MKKIIKIAAIITGTILFLVMVFFGVLTVAEYRPANIESLKIQYHTKSGTMLDNEKVLPVTASRPMPGVPFSMLTWNIGYASLDESQDFFMDGGKGVRPASSENVKRNLAGIREIINKADCDIVLVQEADISSRRSYYVNQREFLTKDFTVENSAGFNSATSVFAYNFKCIFVPIPFPEFIGRVSSGLLTLNRFETAEAQRLSLPNPFLWPTRSPDKNVA